MFHLQNCNLFKLSVHIPVCFYALAYIYIYIYIYMSMCILKDRDFHDGDGDVQFGGDGMD